MSFKVNIVLWYKYYFFRKGCFSLKNGSRFNGDVEESPENERSAKIRYWKNDPGKFIREERFREY